MDDSQSIGVLNVSFKNLQRVHVRRLGQLIIHILSLLSILRNYYKRERQEEEEERIQSLSLGTRDEQNNKTQIRSASFLLVCAISSVLLYKFSRKDKKKKEKKRLLIYCGQIKRQPS